MLFYMLYSVFIEKIQSKIFSLFVSQFTFSQATQKTPCLNGKYDIPANIRGGRMALAGENCLFHKKNSHIQAWELGASGISAVSTDTTEPASLSSTGPGCAEASHICPIYFFFAQLSWLQLFRDPTTTLDFLPGKWQNNLHWYLGGEMLAVRRGNQPLYNSNCPNGIKQGYPTPGPWRGLWPVRNWAI